MIEDSHSQNNSYTERSHQIGSFSNNNGSTSSSNTNDVVSDVLDNFKPENKILFNTKKINTDEKLAKL